MASIRPIAAATAICAGLFLFCASAASVKHHDRAAKTDTVQRHRPDVFNGAIVLIDDWEQVPGGGNSDAPAASGSGAESGGEGESVAVADHPHHGPASAPVTIVEYSDFQCPYCRSAEPTLQQVRAKYGHSVRVVYMDFPLGFHPNAMDAALAARCAREQGQFWAYHDALFSGASRLSKPALEQLAASLGLHSSSFDRCLDRRTYASVIEADIAQGRQSGVSGTPTFFINGQPEVGTPPLAQFEKMVDAALTARARK